MDETNRQSFDFDNRGPNAGLVLFLAGAVVGAAAALILAPATGAETRAFLGRRGRQLADDVATRGKQLWDEHGDRVTGAVKRGYERAASRVSEAVNNATDATPTM